MADDADQSIRLPETLQVRLDAAGVTDQASLEAALNADPELKHDFVAFLAQNQSAVAQVMMQQWLAQFAAAPDQSALAQFWQQVPLDMEDAFLATVEQAIAELQQSGEEEAAQVVEGLRVRLDGLNQVRVQQSEIAARVTQWAENLATTSDADVALVWNDIPLDLEDDVVDLVEQQAAAMEQAGATDAAARLYARVASMRQAQLTRSEPVNQPPLVRALLAFLQAESADMAEQVYTREQELLRSDQAQHMLDELAAQATSDLQAAFRERGDLLRILRGPASPGDAPAQQA